MNSKQAAERILGLDKEATKGPWYIDKDLGDIKAAADGQIIAYDEGALGSDKEQGIYNAQLIVESRTLAPAVAKAYLEAVELLKRAQWLGLSVTDYHTAYHVDKDIADFLKQHGGDDA